MRIYSNFTEALSEIKRDVKEMGIIIHTNTYQDKWIGDNPEMETLELQNYMYTVVDPDYRELEPIQPWAGVEFSERINFIGNPGDAWRLRRDIWEEFLEEDGKFSYHYGERLAWQIDGVIKTLREDPNSRQAFMGMWKPSIDLPKTGGVGRVPCTLGYHFQIRKGKLHITYLQRSADLSTHLINDIYLAGRMKTHIAGKLDVEPGNYTHWIGSLHVFKKDVKGVF